MHWTILIAVLYISVLIMRYSVHVQRCRILLEGAVDDKKRKEKLPSSSS